MTRIATKLLAAVSTISYYYLIAASAAANQSDEQQLEIVSRTRTTFLEKYESYRDVVIVHFVVPSSRRFVSFKFVTGEVNLSIFGCSSRNITLYMKHDSLPVINPDGAAFPATFKNITRSPLYHLEFTRDTTAETQYINVTSPAPGSYYAATFISYSDPKYDAIQQQGLTPQCHNYIDATLYATRQADVRIVVEDKEFTATLSTTHTNLLYKFFVPSGIDRGIVLVNNVAYIEAVSNQQLLFYDSGFFIIRLEANRIPNENSTATHSSYFNDTIFSQQFITENTNYWHYLEFIFVNNNNNSYNYDATVIVNFTFRIKLFTSAIIISNNNNLTTSTIISNNTNNNIIYAPIRFNAVAYKEYELIRKSSTETFLFSYMFADEIDAAVPIALNLTNDEFASLTFDLRSAASDIGGTLQIVVVFKPRVIVTNKNRSGVGQRKRTTTLMAEPKNHTVVGCVGSNRRETPTWPNQCIFNDDNNMMAPLILNSSVDNTSVLIPFPESGRWYVTFQLFCDGECTPCNCSGACRRAFDECARKCEIKCTQACNQCRDDCAQLIVARDECSECDCNGPCLRRKRTNATTTSCNTSVIFDVSSFSCVSGDCGDNGQCMFMVSDGIIYSTCVCSNNYRGWSCSDDSQVNPYWLVVFELLLLVLSNLMFLPTVVIAYKREYYVEALIYLSICFFSTFYHACDAGENIISFCLTRLSALQFADFFCALLSIWVTLIAIADLPAFYYHHHLPAICHMVGAIVLAFATTVNKTSLWVFAAPSVTGILIIAVSWYFKYRKVKQLFVNKTYICCYVPVGLIVVTIGLIIYAMLQTTNNYKYLHSMWHIIMAVAVIILLPRRDTFQPETML